MSFRIITALFVVLGLFPEWAPDLGAYDQIRLASSEPQLEKIAVMPFFRGISGYDTNEMLDSSLSGHYFGRENISSHAAQMISRHVQEVLMEHHGGRVIEFRKSAAVYEEMNKDETVDTPRSLARKLGKELGVSHIMIGTVWRYQERIGGSYGVERPASVAFAVYLVDVANGKLLWTESFEEKQRSLSENILETPTFLKRRGRWLSAMELTESGITQIFERYPF